jgi:hypothetical protein
MPALAPTPVPTMIAVGVARPSAQGQAITSTATAFTIPASISPANASQSSGGERKQQHRRDEDGADPIDQALDRRLGALGVRDHARDPAQHGFGADGRHLDQQRAVAIDGAADHLVAGINIHRAALAGQQ